MFYIIKIPWILRKLTPSLVFNIPNKSKTVYITFDDGPVPETTPDILRILNDYSVKATFFCLGKNVEKYQDLFGDIVDAGHAIGNHSFNHKNGWKTKNEDYFADIEKANYLIKTILFRPPYGRLKPSQIKYIEKKYKIIMWDVLSGDFDPQTSKEECVNNVVNNVSSGSIIVFHDSLKAKDKVLYALPKILSKLSEMGYDFSRISFENS